MKLIPYYRFQIDTPFSPAELAQRIKTVTGEKHWFDFSPSHEFTGQVNEHEFEITKNISYRNSFLPIIVGHIEQTASGSTAFILMRLHVFVMCFMLVWLSGVSMGCLLVLANLDEFSLHMLIPFAMLIFGVALVSGGFWFEASKQKRRLIELLSQNKQGN